MSTEQNKTLVRRWFAEFNAYHLDVEQFIDPAMVNHAGPPGRHRGFEHFHTTITDSLAAVPDQCWTVDDVIAEEDKVVCHLTWSGSQQGTYQGGPDGEVPLHPQVQTFWVTEGTFSEHWAVRDDLGLFQQLNIVSSPGGRSRQGRGASLHLISLKPDYLLLPGCFDRQKGAGGPLGSSMQRSSSKPDRCSLPLFLSKECVSC